MAYRRSSLKRKNINSRSMRSGMRSRRLFNVVAWTASFLMVITMLPEDSPAMKHLAALEASVPAVSLEFEELAAGPEGKNINSGKKADNDENRLKNDDKAIAGEIDMIISETEMTDTSDDTITTDMILVSDINNSDTDADAADQTGKKADAATLKNQTVITTKTSDVTGSGNIIIYHTHATEAYMPVSASSTHVTQVEGTVREAGNNLTNALKAKGFSVVHDGTVHDSPSYNKSYNKSLETAKKLISQYGDLQLVIDMHRDAASSANGKPKTAVIDGQTVASFSLVVGTKNQNYAQIRSFAEKIVNKANEMYPGFCTGIIERPYKFNGYLSDRYILLELGNDANTIEQVNTSAIYLADVFANVLKDM